MTTRVITDVDVAAGTSAQRPATPTEVEELEQLAAEHEATASERAQQETARQRRGAYIAEADPLFFKWQRGEATQQQWLDKVAEIRARYNDG